MNNIVENKKPTEVSTTIGQFLLSKKTQIEKALPKHMTADKLLRIVSTEISRTPKLKDCTPQSLITAIVQSAQLGLFPDSLAGECYLIPYENRKAGTLDCQFQIGYKGMLRLAYNSAQIESIEAHSVHENDEFDFCFGTNQYLKFKPNLKNRGENLCYYAQAKLKTGGQPFIILSIEDVNKHRNFSKAASSNYSPWATHYDEMAKKTAIRVLLKYLPRNAEDLNLLQSISLDEQADLGMQDNNSIIDSETGEIIANQTKSSKLTQKLEENNESSN
jgi:recombination protein RecT